MTVGKVRERRYAAWGAGIALVAALAGCSVPAVPATNPSSSIGLAESSAAVMASAVAAPMQDSVSPTPVASAAPSPRTAGGTATRLVIAALRVDLPVIAGGSGVPPCGVALYLPELLQPGQPGPVYLYGESVAGTLLSLSQAVASGRSLIGMAIEV